VFGGEYWSFEEVLVNGVTYLPKDNRRWRGVYCQEQPLLARGLLSRTTFTGEGFTLRTTFTGEGFTLRTTVAGEVFLSRTTVAGEVFLSRTTVAGEVFLSRTQLVIYSERAQSSLLTGEQSNLLAKGC
jgi:hypothetical protein